MDELRQDDSSKLIKLLLLMGENYIKSGAEIWRVEDMLSRVGYAYGAKEVNAFVITSCIFLTITYSDGHIETQTKRIKRGATDLRKLEWLNSLSRKICKDKISLTDFEKELLTIISRKEDEKELFIGSILIGGAFALFFGGNVVDIILSALVGIIVCLLQIYVEPLCMNAIAYKFVGSFITGTIISMITKFVSGAHQDIIMIADIMILIPGIMFTNSLRDVLLGDTLSGILRFVEAALLACAVVVGFVASMFLFGGKL